MKCMMVVIDFDDEQLDPRALEVILIEKTDEILGISNVDFACDALKPDDEEIITSSLP